MRTSKGEPFQKMRLPHISSSLRPTNIMTTHRSDRTTFQAKQRRQQLHFFSNLAISSSLIRDSSKCRLRKTLQVRVDSHSSNTN